MNNAHLIYLNYEKVIAHWQRLLDGLMIFLLSLLKIYSPLNQNFYIFVNFALPALLHEQALIFFA